MIAGFGVKKVCKDCEVKELGFTLRFLSFCCTYLSHVQQSNSCCKSNVVLSLLFYVCVFIGMRCSLDGWWTETPTGSKMLARNRFLFLVVVGGAVLAVLSFSLQFCKSTRVPLYKYTFSVTQELWSDTRFFLLEFGITIHVYPLIAVLF